MTENIQSVKGILQCTEKEDKNKKPFLELSVGGVVVRQFSYNPEKYAEAKETALQFSGKPVVLEYSARGQYKEYASLTEDPNPPEQGTASEVMTKSDWEAKDRKRWRVECLRIAANIRTLEQAEPLGFVAMAREFEKYVYEELDKEPEKKKPEGEAKQAISDDTFRKIVKAMGYTTGRQICEGLGIVDLKDWKEKGTREEALDKLGEAKNINWREIDEQ